MNVNGNCLSAQLFEYPVGTTLEAGNKNSRFLADTANGTSDFRRFRPAES